MIRIFRHTIFVAADVINASGFHLRLRTIVVGKAESLQIVSVEEQLLISLMRDDVVNNLTNRYEVLFFAHDTQRIAIQMVASQSLPPRGVVQMCPIQFTHSKFQI